MEKEVDSKELEKIVREAGLYEENLSEDTLKYYYKVITNSRETAITENESRKCINNKNDISPKSKNMKSVAQKCSPKSNDKIENETQDATEARDAIEANIPFSDMHNSEEESFRIFGHSMKFFNIQSSDSFLNADVNEKSKMLYSYHTTVGKLRAQLSRQSYFSASMPKPIIIKDMSTSLLTDYELEDEKKFVTEDTYISRSGRQTKRKLYNEDDENSLDSECKKKQKNDELEFKKSKKCQRKSESSQESVDNELKNVENKSPAVTIKSVKKIGKLTNEEIIKRSSLFSNSPKPKLRSARCELMFDKLKDESEKRNKQEKEQQAFERKLEDSEEIFQDQNLSEKEEIISITEDEVVRKRIIPPVPSARKNIHHKSRQESDNEKTSAKKRTNVSDDATISTRLRQKN